MLHTEVSIAVDSSWNSSLIVDNWTSREIGGIERACVKIRSPGTIDTEILKSWIRTEILGKRAHDPVVSTCYAIRVKWYTESRFVSVDQSVRCGDWYERVTRVRIELKQLSNKAAEWLIIGQGMNERVVKQIYYTMIKSLGEKFYGPSTIKHCTIK